MPGESIALRGDHSKPPRSSLIVSRVFLRVRPSRVLNTPLKKFMWILGLDFGSCLSTFVSMSTLTFSVVRSLCVFFKGPFQVQNSMSDRDTTQEKVQPLDPLGDEKFFILL
jgi:hypothetical protein